MFAKRKRLILPINSMLLVLMLAVLVLIATSRPTQAQTPLFFTVRERTEDNRDDFKDLTVSCPRGTKAISGGAGIFYNSEDAEDLQQLPNLISNFMYPNDASWFAEAIQPEDTLETWSLEVHVTCVEDSNRF